MDLLLHRYVIKADCPTATGNVAVNLRNREKAIKEAKYGPLNPAEPNTEFWNAKAERWEVSVAEAKKSVCGNCAAFIQTPEMLECIKNGLAEGDTDENAWDTVRAGRLGYCEAFDFKCASSRTCDAWISGGPVTKNRKGLENKVKEHNESVGDAKGKRTSLGVLQQVFNRGVGAYRTNPSSVRPNVNSEEQWAMGRVNGFLHALRTGRFKRKAYDTDLLPKEHPLSSKKD